MKTAVIYWSGTGSTTFAAEGIPADYQKKYAVADGFTVADGTISYTNAKPRSYKLTISDQSGKYADLTASFVLETDALPVQFKNGKLVAADGYSEEDAQNFIQILQHMKSAMQSIMRQARALSSCSRKTERLILKRNPVPERCLLTVKTANTR